MDWHLLAERLHTAFSTRLSLPQADWTVYISDRAPDLEALMGEAAETEADRSALSDEGWYAAGGRWDLREVLSFEYLSSPAGGTVAWWLLEAGNGQRYAVYQTGDEPTVAFARLEGDPSALFGPVLEQFLATGGEGVGVGESITMLPDLVHNHAPGILTEASARAGAFSFMRYAEERYGGGEPLPKGHSDPLMLEEEREAAFAAYWERAYTEAENPFAK